MVIADHCSGEFRWCTRDGWWDTEAFEESEVVGESNVLDNGLVMYLVKSNADAGADVKGVS
jgi:hypothetical protein